MTPFDLVGDPIPKGFGTRGRPEHNPTDENRNKIRLLLALGWTNARIAQALRTAGKTLSKHYLPGLRQRDEARPAPDCLGLAIFERAGHCGAASR